jgi:hypothetical protein
LHEAAPRRSQPDTVEAHQINAWIRIGTDDALPPRWASWRWDQGVLTSAPMALAEDLEVDWLRIRAHRAPAVRNALLALAGEPTRGLAVDLSSLLSLLLVISVMLFNCYSYVMY